VARQTYETIRAVEVARQTYGTIRTAEVAKQTYETSRAAEVARQTYGTIRTACRDGEANIQKWQVSSTCSVSDGDMYL
jgi:hypothetical protein